jgi:hypothetical protein
MNTVKIDGVDCVAQLDPSTTLRGYVEAVNRHLAVCTDPRVEGAHAGGFPSPQGTGHAGTGARVAGTCNPGRGQPAAASADTTDAH